MAEERKIALKVEVDASGVKSGFDEVGRQADAAAKAGAAVQGAVFNAVLSGNDEWKLGRWLLAFVDGGAKGAYVQPMERDAFVTTWPRLVKDVDGGECLCSSAELLDMASACMHRLQQRDRKPASHGAFSLTGVIHA